MNKYECDYCGDEFERYSSQINGDNKFCSRSCSAQYQVQERPIEEHNFYNGGPAIVECAECGDELERRPCKLDRSEKFFCSTECESDYKTGRLCGENHPNWKGGVRINYGNNWHQKRKERLEIDDHECVVCGKSNTQEKKDTGSELTIHHLRPIRSYMDENNDINYEKANKINNLLTLCVSCHRKWEGIPLKPETGVNA